MALKLDGKLVANQLKQALCERVADLQLAGKPVPCLAVILVGDNPASQIYVRNKIKACEFTGIKSKEILLPSTVTEYELIEKIDELNQDATVHGILCQLPLPQQITAAKVIEAIAPQKDVDGFHPFNAGSMFLGLPSVLPCTPAGIIEILDYYKFPYAGKHAIIVGRSNIVGKPMAQLLLQKNCTVTIAHSHTRNLADLCRQADLLVTAVGQLNLIDQNYVNPEQYVIDVSINRNAEGKVCGDVVTAAVEPIVAALTPVPGGVGPMTIAMLLKNTLELYEQQTTAG